MQKQSSDAKKKSQKLEYKKKKQEEIKRKQKEIDLEIKKLQDMYSRLLEAVSKRKGKDQELIQSISISCPRHQTGKEHIQTRQHKIKTARAESQEDSSFPADGHEAILIKMYKKSKTNRNRTNFDN